VKSPHGYIGGARTLVRSMGRIAMVQAYEIPLMASLAANPPLHLIGGGFDRPLKDRPAVAFVGVGEPDVRHGI
jgi:hypothetical protein